MDHFTGYSERDENGGSLLRSGRDRETDIIPERDSSSASENAVRAAQNVLSTARFVEHSKCVNLEITFINDGKIILISSSYKLN